MAGLPPPGDPIWQELIKNPSIQQLLLKATQRDAPVSEEKLSPERLRYMADRAVRRAPSAQWMTGGNPEVVGAKKNLNQARHLDWVIDDMGGAFGGGRSIEELEKLRDSHRASAINRVPPVEGEAIIAILNNLLNPSIQQNPLMSRLW